LSGSSGPDFVEGGSVSVDLPKIFDKIIRYLRVWEEGMRGAALELLNCSLHKKRVNKRINILKLEKIELKVYPNKRNK
jgi:hypothetical protein